jgi:hypothetical protein
MFLGNCDCAAVSPGQMMAVREFPLFRFRSE